MPSRKKQIFESQMLSDHEKKNFSILELVRRNGAITRAEISKETDLNIVTISNYINTYISEGMVVEGGIEASSGGRRPSLVKLNQGYGYAVGIDLGHMGTGGSSMLGIVTDLSGKVLTRVEHKREKDNMDKVITKSFDLIEELINKEEIYKGKIKGVGIGIGGVIDGALGTIRDSSKDGVRTNYLSIIDSIDQKFGIPAFLGNDASFAAFGEKMYTIPIEVEDIIYMYSDVGTGIIIKGDVYCGASGSAGEIRINVPQSIEYLKFSKSFAFLLPLGLDLGLVSQAGRLIGQEGIKSNISSMVNDDLETITVDVIIQAAKSGDALAIELLEDAAVNLGVRVSYLVNL